MKLTRNNPPQRRVRGDHAAVLNLQAVRSPAALKWAVAVMDRSDSFGAQGGPLYLEIRSALFDSAKKPKLTNYIFGLGGRDTSKEDIEKVFNEIISGKSLALNYLGVRE